VINVEDWRRFVAFRPVAGNQGVNTAGVDGVTVAMVEVLVGAPGFLDDILAQLKAGTFRPLPYAALYYKEYPDTRGPNIDRRTYQATTTVNVLAGRTLTTDPEP
jgi:retron-type reverse transcriptase